MKSFVCVLLGSLLLSAVLAVPNRFSPFARDVSFVSGWTVDDRKVEFNQTEIDQLIKELTLIRPVLSNTYQEIYDYISSFTGLHYLQYVNETKQIPSERNYNQTKELIIRNRHYLDVIVTDSNQLVQQRKTEGAFNHMLDRLYDLLPKLISKNNTVGIEVIGQHIDVDTKLLGILRRNLTYNAPQVKSLLERANQAIEEYSKQL